MHAEISPDGLYRYTLHRGIIPAALDAAGEVLFVMLNPSTADDRLDDPTVRRCIGYAREWGYGDLAVCNLFAYRATDPKQLYTCPDPVGPDNDRHIIEQAARAQLVVAAWGAHGGHLDRDVAVLDLIDKPVHCLAVTKAGKPGHPLYLGRHLRPMLYR